MEIHEKLAQLRKEKGLSQMEVATELGVSRQAVSRWERGITVPTSDNLFCLGQLYEVPLDELVYGDLYHAIAEEDTASAMADATMDEPSGTADTEMEEASKSAKSWSHNKIIWFTLFAAGLCGIVSAWGELTNSRGGALLFVEFTAIVTALGWLVHGVHKIILFIINKKG